MFGGQKLHYSNTFRRSGFVKANNDLIGLDTIARR
jgi:hypothetical protein